MFTLLSDKDDIFDAMRPDLISNTEGSQSNEDLGMKSMNLESMTLGSSRLPDRNGSFLLIDGKEEMQVRTAADFTKLLRCQPDTKVKVVSIFGNTGDGKSHTLNHTFFDGKEVFRTSPAQASCTLGVWAAMDRKSNVICLDTEGMMGTTNNDNKRIRILLKILAISDIAVYRTRSERLRCDMYTFLGSASKAFVSHFADALQSLDLPNSTKGGPGIVIFHETVNTHTLETINLNDSAEDRISNLFKENGVNITEVFNKIRYVGVNSSDGPTDFNKLRNALQAEINNNVIRSPREPSVIFRALQSLNSRFSGSLDHMRVNPFPEEYFTCGLQCDACGGRCERSMGHSNQGEGHKSSKKCRYQHKYENKVFMCNQCHRNGRDEIVYETVLSNADTSLMSFVKYAWSGSVIECKNCGEIYRSRTHWYGNSRPEDTAVRTEIMHVWKGEVIGTRQPNHSAQMILDGVSLIKDTITSISAQPTKQLSDYIANAVAPTYWKKNDEIVKCYACLVNFEETPLSKHHCRGCGEGFCNTCSNFKMKVPARGWDEAVRVCNSCREILLKDPSACPEPAKPDIPNPQFSAGNVPSTSETDIRVRKYGEVLYNAVSSISTVLEYPKDYIKDQARPTYWVPDADAPKCAICQSMFGTAEELASIQPDRYYYRNIVDRKRHHCRACGGAVCDDCSPEKKPVPDRGWHTPVRVCNHCYGSL